MNQYITNRIDNIISNGFTIVVGDANGADKSLQKYLNSKNYRNVVVFCVGDRCRNNEGNWEIRHISADIEGTGFNFYAAKDAQMAKEASYGFMIWDAKSSGTLNNIINILKENKKVLVYISSEKCFYTLHNASELAEILEKCDKISLEKFDKKLGVTKFLGQEQPRLGFV